MSSGQIQKMVWQEERADGGACLILSPFQSFEVPMQDAAAAGRGLELPFSTQQHFIAQNPSPLNVPLPSLPASLPPVPGRA